ncbi:MAG: transporter, partial [Pseudomonadota bacterium]
MGLSKFMQGIAVAAVCAVTPINAAAESLTDALITAYRHSHLLDQNRALLRAADEGVAQAVAALRPIISFAAAASKNTDLDELDASAQINANLLLFDNG